MEPWSEVATRKEVREGRSFNPDEFATRLVDPDAILKSMIVEFVSHGAFGLASGSKPDGGYERV